GHVHRGAGRRPDAGVVDARSLRLAWTCATSGRPDAAGRRVFAGCRRGVDQALDSLAQKKSPAEAGLFRQTLSVPTMLADHDAVVAIAVRVVVIPATVPAAVMLVDPDTRAVIAVAIISVVAADVDSEAFRVGDGRSADRKRRCRRKCVSELSHVF